YRETSLTSNLPGIANAMDAFLQSPWGITALPDGAFFVAISSRGRAISLDVTGAAVPPSGFSIPNPAGTGPANPFGIVADPNSFFGHAGHPQPFSNAVVLATTDGGIYFWGVNADGTSLSQATLEVDHSQTGAVYTAAAILTPNCCAPYLAVANFR